jgi:tetratricopeptide (TPR) repeat protein
MMLRIGAAMAALLLPGLGTPLPRNELREEGTFLFSRFGARMASTSRRRGVSPFRPILAVTLALTMCAALEAQGDLLKRGLSLMKALRPAEAEQVLGAIPPAHADYPSARTLLGYLLLQRSALAQAEIAFRTVLQAEPGNAPASLGLGMTLLRRGSGDRAASELEKILADPAVGLQAQIQWIHSLFLADRIDDAVREARQMTAEHNAAPEVHSLLGFLYLVRSETGEALREYRLAVQLDPRDLSAYLSLISLYRSQEDWEAALRSAQAALALDPHHPLLYRELALVLDKLGRSQEAAAARARAEAVYDAEILYARAMRAKGAGRKDEAEKLLRESVGRNRSLSKAWNDLGELLRAEQRWEEARGAFLHVLEDSPDDSRAVAGLAATLEAQGKAAEALRYYQEAVLRGSASPDMLTAMAAIYRDQEKPQAAESAVLQAIQQLPDNPDLMSYLGHLQQSAGKTREALESYSAALRLDPQKVEALTGQARSLLQQGDIRGALASLNLARSLEPDNTGILKELILAYEQAADAKSAESGCRECLKINPEDPECREQLAALRMAARDYQESAAHFRFILDKGTASRSVLNGLAFSLMHIGDLGGAILMSERSLRDFVPDAQVHAGLGYLYRCRGDLQSALKNYRAARDLAPTDPERNLDLGFTLYLARDFKGALAPLLAALRLRPDWGTAQYYLAMTYWNLGQHVLALSYARMAQKQGVPEAKPAVQALSKSSSFGTPGSVTIQRARR